MRHEPQLLSAAPRQTRAITWLDCTSPAGAFRFGGRTTTKLAVAARLELGTDGVFFSSFHLHLIFLYTKTSINKEMYYSAIAHKAY